MAQELQQVLAGLGLEGFRDVFDPHWEQSEATFPAGGPPFLQPQRFAEVRRYIELAPEADAALAQAALRVRQDPAFEHLAWHMHELLHRQRDYDAGQIRNWPSLEPQLGHLAGTFYLLLALATVPIVRDIHRQMGIPEHITRNTCRHFRSPIDFYRTLHDGRWGYSNRTIYWMRHHTAGVLFGVGRMEYMVRPFGGRVRVFREQETRKVVALAEAGQVFTPQGYIDAGVEEPVEGGWVSDLVEGPGAVTGCPIAPHGVCIQETVRLEADRWHCVLQPGDPVLDMHIPGGGGMTLDKCRESMQEALEFFPRYLPDRPFKGFACGSWILNPELEHIYSPDSNMVLYQRELYLFPMASWPRAGLYFVFGDEDIDPQTAPRDTSLRRALLDHILAGGRLRVSGMFFLTEDFVRFGTQVYRSDWANA